MIRDLAKSISKLENLEHPVLTINIPFAPKSELRTINLLIRLRGIDLELKTSFHNGFLCGNH